MATSGRVVVRGCLVGVEAGLWAIVGAFSAGSSRFFGCESACAEISGSDSGTLFAISGLAVVFFVDCVFAGASAAASVCFAAGGASDAATCERGVSAGAATCFFSVGIAESSATLLSCVARLASCAVAAWTVEVGSCMEAVFAGSVVCRSTLALVGLASTPATLVGSGAGVWIRSLIFISDGRLCLLNFDAWSACRGADSFGCWRRTMLGSVVATGSGTGIGCWGARSSSRCVSWRVICSSRATSGVFVSTGFSKSCLGRSCSGISWSGE